MPIAITTPKDANPPSTTDGTGPRSFAATPDSNAPSSFDEPTKIEFTDDTRPNKSRGVSTCNNVERTSTLTLSAIPLTPRSTIDSNTLLDSPNPTMQSAKTATA